MKEWHFFEKTLRVWVVLFIGTPDEFRAELEHNGYKELDEINCDGAGGMCLEMTPENNTSGQNCFIIWLREWSVPTLVHEITHLVMFIFRRSNIPIEIESTDIFALHTEYWFTEITRARRRQPGGRTPAEARK